MLVVMLIQSGLTPQSRGVGTFCTLGGSCNLNSRLCNLVPRALPNVNTERKALSCVVMSCVMMSYVVMSCNQPSPPMCHPSVYIADISYVHDITAHDE